MKQRVITAIVALLFFIPIVWYGEIPFVILTYLMASIGLFELSRMYGKSIIFPIPHIIATIGLWFLLIPGGQVDLLIKVKALLLLTIILLIYTVVTENRFTFTESGFILLSVIYISIGFYFFMHARFLGLNYLLFVLFTIWATDTGAYFVGNAFGRRKLWPKISPNKTVEGAIGGLVISLLIAVLFQVIYPFDKPFYMMIIVAGVISVFGQIGDLVASAFKRHYQVKDSGNILPGHGGILDRLDSLLFVLPILYIISFI